MLFYLILDTLSTLKLWNQLIMQYSNSIHITCRKKIKLIILQKEIHADCIFQSIYANESSLFRESNILKLPDKVVLESCLNKYFNNFLPKIFKNWFILSSDFHTYSTGWSNLVCLVLLSHNTKQYGNSVNINTIYKWDYLNDKMKIIFLINCYQVSLRLLSKSFFMQLQLILIQLIIMHVTSDSPILGLDNLLNTSYV